MQPISSNPRSERVNHLQAEEADGEQSGPPQKRGEKCLHAIACSEGNICNGLVCCPSTTSIFHQYVRPCGDILMQYCRRVRSPYQPHSIYYPRSMQRMQTFFPCLWQAGMWRSKSVLLGGGVQLAWMAVSREEKVGPYLLELIPL